MKKKLLSVLVAAALGCGLFSAVPIISQADSTGSVTMYRLYNPNSGEHFYTGSEEEKTDLVTAGWRDEGIGWIAPVTSNTPVYRLYNENSGDHHYTLQATEKDSLIDAGWKSEGIGWYSDDEKAVPLYREYNPNAVTGTHNYTTDKAEHDSLVKTGWKDEGIGWYATRDGKKTVYDALEIGDIVVFGTYEQDNDLTNGSEPIEWKYIADRDGHKYLLSKYVLDCMPYHNERGDITWEHCALRKWLNEDFYDTAFSAKDKEKIVTAYNENPDSYKWWEDFHLLDWVWGADGGNDTYDNVFLMSWPEAEEYCDGKKYVGSDLTTYDPINYNPALLCSPTRYAKVQGAYTFSAVYKTAECPTDVGQSCNWWLRSPGDSGSSAAYVHPFGSLGSNSAKAALYVGIRPAIIIN